MSIQVIHNKYYFFAIRITDIYQIFYFFCPVNRCTVFTDTYMAYTTQGLHKHKDTDGPITCIFRIHFLGIS